MSTGERVNPSIVYDGFLSYSHAADDLLAPRLQSALQRFAKPWWKRRAVRIFRDESSLSANPHLWSAITEALDTSGWFVLLLSPDAAESEWVNQEVAYWVENRDPKRILPVLTDGDFGWTGGDVAGDAVPDALRGVFSEEPRWVDLRFAKQEDQLDLKHPGFNSAVADIAAAIRGIPKDELASEEVRQHRRTIRTAWAAGVALALLALLAGWAAVFALNEQAETEAQNQRLSAAALAETAMEQTAVDPQLAALLAQEAIAQAVEHGADPKRAVAALHVALQELSVQFPSQSTLREIQGVERAVRVTTVLGPDGKRGVFLLPIRELFELADSAQLPTLSDSQCDDYLDAACPAPPLTRLPDEVLDLEVLVEPNTPFDVLEGTDLRIDSTFLARNERSMRGYEGPLSMGLFEELELWGDNSGVDPFSVNIVGLTSGGNADFVLVQAHELFGEPETTFGASARVLRTSQYGQRFETAIDPFDLGDWLPPEVFSAKEPPALTNALRGPDGQTEALWTTWQPFGIWFRPDVLGERSLTAPRTWESLLRLSEDLSGEGITPWCLGGRGGGSPNRYLLTMVAAVLVQSESVEFYDDWLAHRIPASDDRVLDAFSRLEELLFRPGHLDAPRATAVRRPWNQSGELGRPTPTCAMWFGPTEETALVTRDLGFWPIPGTTDESAGLLVSGTVMIFNTDRPETRSLATYVASPFFGQRYSLHGTGVAANAQLSGTAYSQYTGRTAQLAQAVSNAIDADSLRPAPHSTASIPAPVLAELEEAVATWLAEGVDALPAALARVEAAWLEWESAEG